MLRHVFAALAAVALYALPPSSAVAQGHSSDHPGAHPGGRDHGSGGAGGGHSGAHVIPEFDPSAAGAIGVALAGGILLVARRRQR